MGFGASTAGVISLFSSFSLSSASVDSIDEVSSCFSSSVSMSPGSSNDKL